MSVYAKFIIALLYLLTITAFAQYTTPMQTSQMYTITTANNSTVGTYLTDSSGMALYRLMTDEGKNMSTCTNTTCTGHWPPVYAATIKVPSNLNPGNFKNITVDGYKQTTYNGWPLYRFAGDKKPGDINGQGKLGVWSVVTP